MASFKMISTSIFQPIKLTFLALVYSLQTSLVSATFTFERCCTLAVRSEYAKYYSDPEAGPPWTVCNYGVELEYGANNNETYLSITKPLWWVKEFCNGTQLSNTNQWLLPLSTYISPYIGLLLLCPIGESAEEKEEDHEKEEQERTTGKMKSLGKKVVGFLGVVMQFVAILGDPASAVSGAASEIYADTVALWNVSLLPKDIQRARWVAALAGALKFSSKTDWRQQQPEGTSPAVTTSPRADSEPFLVKGSVATPTEVASSPRPDADEADRAISLCIAARASFASTILIPVVLMLAVTAATFYDAHKNPGDKDTALALAYCIWYSWILVPAVAGNCFATVLSPDLAKRAFYKVMQFSEGDDESGVDVMALRQRHVNNQYWGYWLKKQENLNSEAKDLITFKGELARNTWFWIRFIGWNLIGWCVVGVASGAGVAIAWTTPTVGLGCRSMNILLYAIIAFVNAFLHVLYSWLAVREDAKNNGDIDTAGANGSSQGIHILNRKLTLTPLTVVRAIYWFLVVVNAVVVMTLGTIFHLVGVYRTCWCDRITTDNNALIELNRKTEEAVVNAKRYWISTAYVVFSIMTFICVLAVAFRQVVSRRMNEWIEEEEDGDDEKET